VRGCLLVCVHSAYLTTEKRFKHFLQNANHRSASSKADFKCIGLKGTELVTIIKKLFRAATQLDLTCPQMQSAMTHMHARMHARTHTHTHTQPFYGSLHFVWDNPGESVPEELFTHSHISWSSIIPYLLPSSFTIHGILPIQFTCPIVFFTISLQVFFGLPLGLAPSNSYSIHFFTQSLSSFHSTCAYCIEQI